MITTKSKTLQQEFAEIAASIWPDGTPEKKCALPPEELLKFERMFFAGAQVALSRIMRTSYLSPVDAQKHMESLFVEVEAYVGKPEPVEEDDRN